MVPAAFRSPGLVFSSVPYVLVFPVGCSRLVVPGWLFPVGCPCSAPVVSARLPAISARLPAIPARLPAIPARLLSPPPGFGCSCAVSGCSCAVSGCSRLVVPVWLWFFLPRLRLPFPGFGCPSSTSVVPPRLCCPPPPRLRLFPSGCRSFLPPQFAEKKPNVCAVPYFFIYLRVSFRAGGNLPIFVRL